MSVRIPILTVPPEIFPSWAKDWVAASNITVMLTTIPLGFLMVSPRVSYAKMFGKHASLRGQLVLLDLRDDAPVLDHVHSIDQRRREAQVLFDQNDGQPRLAQLADHLPQPLHD